MDAKQEELSIGLEGVANESKPVSKEIDNRFSITEKGSKILYAYSNDPETVAFTEKENKLTANDNNPALIKTMLEVAESKGWENITVTGDKEFKRDVWMEAKSRGLDVNGYKPTQQDERKLDRLLDKQNSIGQERESNLSNEDSQPSESDNVANEQSIPTVSEEEREEKEKALKTAYKTLDKEEAIEKYPELGKVYEVAPSAVAFYRSKGGTPEQEEDFKTKATDKAIEELAAGNKIPDFDVSSYKKQQKQTETRQEREIDYE